MPVRVAKEFRFEAAHRLPWHEGQCANLHGHSYHLTVELTGRQDARGMVVDFQHIKQLLSPLIRRWDHAVLVAESDEELLSAVKGLGSRFDVLPFDTTAENIATYAADFVLEEGRSVLERHGISRLVVSVRETLTSQAIVERTVD